MALFGLDLGGILRLQAILPHKRTILLDTRLDNSDSLVPWFRDGAGDLSATEIVPLGKLVQTSQPQPRNSILDMGVGDFLYAKIGIEDALALPDLLPGSIVRINPHVSKELLPTQVRSPSDRIFLIEHCKGFWCSRLYLLDENHLVPLSNRLPYANVSFECPTQIRILGVVEMEIRLVHNPIRPELPRELADQWKPEPLNRHATRLGGLLRRSRIRAALSLREVSSMSHRIADLLNDDRYFVAPGALSDYEAQDDPPRQIRKSIALCALYGIPFDTFLDAIGVVGKALGKDVMPVSHSELEAGGSNVILGSLVERQDDPNLRALMTQFGNVPFFLGSTLGFLAGMKKVSLRDFFWMGPKTTVLHPHVHGALLLFVNRHKKKTIHSRSLPWSRQPLYLLLRRDGRYICACCSLEGKDLVIHPYPADLQLPEPIEKYRDAEIVGQVAAIARKLDSPHKSMS